MEIRLITCGSFMGGRSFCRKGKRGGRIGRRFILIAMQTFGASEVVHGFSSASGSALVEPQSPYLKNSGLINAMATPAAMVTTIIKPIISTKAQA